MKCRTAPELFTIFTPSMDDAHYSSPPHTADSATPLFQASDPFLLTPNRRLLDAEDTATNSQYGDESQFSSQPSSLYLGLSKSFKPPRSKQLFQGFEKPNLARIAIISVLCLSAYPALYILTLVARDKSLYTVRLIVAMWCSGVGFTLGYVLLKIGVRHLEAASE